MDEHDSIGRQEHLDDGKKYLRTALNGLSRPSVFNNELIFQLTAMAVEKMMVGIYNHYGDMPYDHTLTGLVNGLFAYCTMDEELSEKIKWIESMDNMCALTLTYRKDPDDEDIRKILSTGRELEAFIDGHLSTENVNL